MKYVTAEENFLYLNGVSNSLVSSLIPVCGTGTSIVVSLPPLRFYLGRSEKILLAIRALLKSLAAWLGSMLGLLVL